MLTMSVDAGIRAGVHVDGEDHDPDRRTADRRACGEVRHVVVGCVNDLRRRGAGGDQYRGNRDGQHRCETKAHSRHARFEARGLPADQDCEAYSPAQPRAGRGASRQSDFQT